MEDDLFGQIAEHLKSVDVANTPETSPGAENWDTIGPLIDIFLVSHLFRPYDPQRLFLEFSVWQRTYATGRYSLLDMDEIETGNVIREIKLETVVSYTGNQLELLEIIKKDKDPQSQDFAKVNYVQELYKLAFERTQEALFYGEGLIS